MYNIKYAMKSVKLSLGQPPTDKLLLYMYASPRFTASNIAIRVDLAWLYDSQHVYTMMM